MEHKKEEQIDALLNQFIEAKNLNKVKSISVKWAGNHSPTPYEIRVEFDLFVSIDSIMEIQDLLEDKYENLVSNVEVFTPFQLPVTLSFFVPWTKAVSMLQYKKGV
jgi:hypothetical protein